MKSKVERLAEEIEKYEDNITLRDNIEARLQKTLENYLDQLESSSDRILSKKLKTVYREINR